jgi:hypothetical protein
LEEEFMENIRSQIASFGIVPVIAIDDAKDALPSGKH